MKKSVLTLTKTTPENASLSWKDDLENMISKYPIHGSLESFGGGFFESLPQAHNFLNDCLKKHGYVYKKIDNAFNENN